MWLLELHIISWQRVDLQNRHWDVAAELRIVVLEESKGSLWGTSSQPGGGGGWGGGGIGECVYMCESEGKGVCIE